MSLTLVSGQPSGPPAGSSPSRPEALLASWPLKLALISTGLLMVVAALALQGASWILPDGLLGGGVALAVCAPWCRSVLDPIVVASPFAFYTLSPVGGLLTVGSSDLILPFVVAAMVMHRAFGRATERYPMVRAALPLGVLTAILVTASTVLWSVFSVDFLLTRAIADLVKLGVGLGYLVVTFLLVRRSGLDGALRAFRLWGWTATALSMASLVGITGALTFVPNDGYRSLGYFQDANLYAGYLLVSLSVLMFLSLVDPTPWHSAQALTIVGGIVMTGSRGGLLSLGFLVLFATLVINSVRLRLAVAALGGLVAAGGYWLLTHRDSGVTVLGIDRLFYASENQTVESDPRLDLWARAVEKWMDAPLWGIGAGQFERFSGDVFRVAKSSGLGYVTHNSFLFFLVSFGVLGLGLFLYLIGWMVRDLYRWTPFPRTAKHALFSGLLVIGSQMMTLDLQNQRYVWIYFGLIFGLAHLDRRDLEQAGA